MKNPRRLYHQLRLSFWLWCLDFCIFCPLALIFNKQITLYCGERIADVLLYVSFAWLFVGFLAMIFLYHSWQTDVKNRIWTREDFAFLAKTHLDTMMPSFHSGGSATYMGDRQPDESKVKITNTLWQLLCWMDAETIKTMPSTDRNAFVSLLKSDDVRIVKRVLELSEQAGLIETLPLVRLLAHGFLKGGRDLYIPPIARQVQNHLEAQYNLFQRREYLRASSAPNDELLLPASYTTQSDNLLRPHERKRCLKPEPDLMHVENC